MKGKVLVLLPVLFWALPVGSGEDAQERVPGTIRVEGTPEGLGAVGVRIAFPNLRFHRPLYVDYPRDGTDRLFVLEQDGRVRVFDNRPDVEEAAVALDLKKKVYRGHNEEGLLGMAFHPDFKKNRKVYLHYSARRPRRGVVSEFKMDAARRVIRRKTERVILEQRQPWGNHNGGCLAFGPDGYLYLSFGDGGAADDPLGSGQDLSTWLGTILRIDVDKKRPYAVPRDNPFVKRRHARPEIWAYGLRNVWRFSFDRVTGALWGGDVGQVKWEEIDLIEKGGNYGWNAREGKHPFRGGRHKGPFIEPVIDHDRGEARSITGGYVYRGKKLPGLVGAYVYADYETGNIWALRWDGKKVTDHKLIARGRQVASFGEDKDGEIYFTALSGTIYKLAPREAQPAARFPTRLSETGLFTDVKKLTPHASLIPYTVNVPLWSDGAGKERYIMVPGLEKVRVDENGRYHFPRGTIFVKTFFFPGTRQRLETRLLIFGAAGWAGYTYVWDDAQTEAHLIDGRVDKVYGKRTWTFPSRADCMSCHTEVAGYALGFRAEQLDGQLDALARRGLFDGDPRRGGQAPFPDWSQAPEDVGPAVRAYLDANCAMCHQPGGPGNAKIDLRATTPLGQAFLLDEEPGHDALGVHGARIVKPGRPDRSLLYLRMQLTDEKGMPNLAHNDPDEKALKLVRRWIRGLK